jgi:hypothetical protein
MANSHDTLYRYAAGLRAGRFDTDLADDDQARVAYLLDCGVAILSQYGATDRVTLRRMLRDPQSSAAVNDRVGDILFGCMTEGWSR